MKHREKRKISRHSVSQSETQFSQSAKFNVNKTLSKPSKNYQYYHEHPYATRSKVLKRTMSVTQCNERSVRRLSESSIVFLGAFRKVPMLIDLEDTSQLTQHLDKADNNENINFPLCYKVEPMECQNSNENFN